MWSRWRCTGSGGGSDPAAGPPVRFYLSSYGVGNAAGQLIQMSAGRTLGFIPNALDHVAEDAARESHARCLAPLDALGIRHETVDLKDHFGDPVSLRKRLDQLGGLWVRGGNTFVLRQAMRLSGFDEIIFEHRDPDFLWAGYSAGICVLAPTFEGLMQVDDPGMMPYPDSEVLHEGLGFLDYLILPHYRSDHYESELIEQEVAFCSAQEIPFRTLRDGEVLIGSGDPGGEIDLELFGEPA